MHLIILFQKKKKKKKKKNSNEAKGKKNCREAEKKKNTGLWTDSKQICELTNCSGTLLYNNDDKKKGLCNF